MRTLFSDRVTVGPGPFGPDPTPGSPSGQPGGRWRLVREEAGMKHRKIGNVMTDDVVRVRHGAAADGVGALLERHRIGGLPVVDEDDKVVGVITGTDLASRADRTGGG